MPYLKISTNQELSAEQRNDLALAGSGVVAEALGKPERYVMTEVQSGNSMCFAGSVAPLAYLELKSIGLPEDRTGQLSASLCGLVSEQLGIDNDRIYIEFANAERHMWGWDNKTF